MKSISNDLTILSYEIDWARNFLIKNLNEANAVLQDIKDTSPALSHKLITEKILQCLSALEENLEEDSHESVEDITEKG